MTKLFNSKKAHSGHVHIAIGLGLLAVLYLLVRKYYPAYILPLTLLDAFIIGFITVVYSQMPDIDTPSSSISRFITISALLLAGYSVWVNEKNIALAIIGILLFVRFTTHRTLIHSTASALLFAFPLYYIKPIYAYIAFIMFLVHLISEGEFSMFSGKNWKLFEK